MESYDLFNGAVRIKKEPVDESFTVNDGHEVTEKTSTIHNFQAFTIKQENSTHKLQKCDENRRIDLDNLSIEFECQEEKPKFNSWLKIEDSSENYFQIMSRDWNDKKDIKKKSEVKKESVEDNPDNLVTNDQGDLGGQKKLRTSIDTRPKGVIFSCHTCKNTFRHKISLKRHMESVHRKIRHKCDVCGKMFTYKSDLKIHIDSVHNKITHKCDICEKNFSTKRHLKNHVNVIHHGITHACDICQQKFSRKSSLKIHMNSKHGGIRHSCDVCAKKFTRKDNLKVHIEGFHNGINHSCNICGKKFLRKGNLNMHVKCSHRSN